MIFTIILKEKKNKFRRKTNKIISLNYEHTINISEGLVLQSILKQGTHTSMTVRTIAFSNPARYTETF